MMKKLLTITAALLLVLGLSQCTKTKSEMPHYTGEAGDLYIQDVTLTATFPQDNSKVDIYESVTDALGITWEEGDVLTVGGTGTGTLTCTSISNGGKTGTFEGEITGSAGTLTFTYGSGEPSYTGQVGTIEKIKEGLYLTGSAKFNVKGNYDVDMEIPYAILKLDISSLGSPDGNVVTFNNGTSDVVTVKDVDDTFTEVYVVAPADGTEKTYTINGDGLVAEKTWTLEPNTYYTKAGSATGEAIVITGVWYASVVTIPVCAIHTSCASSGGVATGSGIEEWGVCWGTTANPDINGSHYVHQYEYATGKLTPKRYAVNGTFAGFMSGLTANTTYHVRAYIKKKDEVKYGEDLSFTTLATEPALETVNFGTPNLAWAKCNLGATNGTTVESWRGDFYQWGDIAACTGTTEGKTVHCNGWESCRFGASHEALFTKYGSAENTGLWYKRAGNPEGTVDNKLVLDLEDDAARQTLGGDWRMPTKEEWQELIDNNTFVWLTPSSEPYMDVSPVFEAPVVRGYLVIKGKNPEPGETDYMFLPCAGCRINYGNEGWTLNDIGFYYSSSLRTDWPNRANYVILRYVNGGPDHAIYNIYYRNVGMAIRPVHE